MQQRSNNTASSIERAQSVGFEDYVFFSSGIDIVVGTRVLGCSVRSRTRLVGRCLSKRIDWQFASLINRKVLWCCLGSGGVRVVCCCASGGGVLSGCCVWCVVWVVVLRGGVCGWCCVVVLCGCCVKWWCCVSDIVCLGVVCLGVVCVGVLSEYWDACWSAVGVLSSAVECCRGAAVGLSGCCRGAVCCLVLSECCLGAVWALSGCCLGVLSGCCVWVCCLAVLSAVWVCCLAVGRKVVSGCVCFRIQFMHFTHNFRFERRFLSKNTCCTCFLILLAFASSLMNV